MNIIAIDFGHCEDAGTTISEITFSDGKRKSFKVDMLKIQDKDQIILSQIFLTNEQMHKLSGKIRPTFSELKDLGEISFGNKIPVDPPDGEWFCYFKVPPVGFDTQCGNSETAKSCRITHGQVMACFVFALVNSIIKHNDTIFSENGRRNIDLWIGCPSTSDWIKPDAISEYKNLVKRALSVHDVYIIPESRAAMFSSIASKNYTISAVNGALVFDFGSSTADCTYMLLGRKRIEFSYTLGASEIERNMILSAIQSGSQGEHKDLEISANSFVKNENIMRNMKEKFYSHQVEEDGEDIICKFSKSFKALITIDGDFMRHVTEEVEISIRPDSKGLKKGSWRSLAREFFQEAKNRIDGTRYYEIDAQGNRKQKACPISTIILTGGASRMDFLYEDCKKIFPGIEIIREDNPSYTVATGLSWVAISDISLNECIEAAENKVKDNYKCEIFTLRRKVSSAMFSAICDIVRVKTQEWADKLHDASANDLKHDIELCMNDPATQRKFSQVCKDEIDKWKNELADTVCQAVNLQAQKIFSDEVARGLMMPQDLWKQLQPDIFSSWNADFSQIFTNLDLGGLLNQVIRYIIALVIWGAAGWLALATFGLSLVVGLFLHALAEVLLTDDNLNEPRSKNVRERVASSIVSKLKENQDEFMKGFDAKFDAQTQNFDAERQEIIRSAFEVITLNKFDL